MSYIPDCRTDEVYNVENVSENDKQFVKGYDYCTECAVDNFFDNLDVFFDDDSHIMHVLKEELPRDLKETYEVTFGDETETRDIETYLDLLRARLLEYIENERNELITSMVDDAYEGSISDSIETYK